ncbi:Translin-associated factor X-interacting protein 1 [Sorochytrium milnesiophthora]
MAMNDQVSQWRTLARHDEYLPSQLTVRTASPAEIASQQDARAVAESPSSASTTVAKHLVPLSPTRKGNLGQVLDFSESVVRDTIRDRVSGHLNHEKVFSAMRPHTIAFDGSFVSPTSTGKRGVAFDIAPEQTPSSDALPQIAGSASKKNSRRSRSMSPTSAAVSEMLEVKKQTDYARLLEEDLGGCSGTFDRVRVADHYFDTIIKEFRVHSSALAAIKQEYSGAISAYRNDLSELAQLRSRLMQTISAYERSLQNNLDNDEEKKRLQVQVNDLQEASKSQQETIEELNARIAHLINVERKQRELLQLDVGSSVMRERADDDEDMEGKSAADPSSS